PFILFESGKSVGANILTWGHIKVFSPWKYNMDKVAEKLLLQNGIAIPDKEVIPFGKELVTMYLQPLSELPEIKKHLHLHTQVMAIGRKGLDKVITANREKLPFSIQVNENGRFKIYEAKAVIDATGTWHNPNPIGSGGVFAIGELENAAHINYGIPDILEKNKKRYANKTVLVVGGGHSAIHSVLDLDKLVGDFPKTKIHWLLRKNHISEVYGGQDADALEARGALGIRIEKLVNSGRLEVHTPVYIYEVQKENSQLKVTGTKKGKPFKLEGVDEIISNTGTRPDFSFLREVRFDADAALESVPKLAELIDPNIHSCGTVRPHGEAELRQKEQGFYIVGMKSYGRAPTFLMATGYEQVRSIVAYLNGDFDAAKRVELDLPETGVCNSGISDDDDCCGVSETKGMVVIAESGCCGSSSASSDSCC
ncbi:MAG TPA: flavoprotein, partial [Phaeodactylibacter sp.]|nr:flavoprotein [Phaeodactylibacter sp.]